MKKKSMLAILLAVSMVMGMTGCGQQAEEPVVNDTAEEVTQEAQEEETEAKEESTAQEEEAEVKEEQSAEEQLPQGNMIENGDFASRDLKWDTYCNGGSGSLSVTPDKMLAVKVKDCGNLDYSVQAYYDGFRLDQGVVYKFSFDMYADTERTVVWRIQINGGDYHAYMTETLTATTDMQHYEYELKMEEPSDPAPRLCFNLGTYEADGVLDEHTVYFDNFDLEVLDSSSMEDAAQEIETPDILINQVGYQPNDIKEATFRGGNIGSEFDVVDTTNGEVVFTGKISESFSNEASEETTATGDFTSVTAPGSYKIVSDGCGESYEFEIAQDVYDKLLTDTVRMFYLQRCGMELTEDLAGEFAHPICHAASAKHYKTGETLDVSGGWHDAGDYGRYVVPGAKAAADLLLAYEMNPSVFTDHMDIPESGNGVPDVLDEVKYELDWMMKMQDASGGVYHKVTCANFPGTVLPQDETEELLVMPVSNTATGDFAAVMAIAARVYEKTDADYAAKCLEGSKKALQYLIENIDRGGFANPTDIATGEYPDTNDEDELLWALAELYKTTKDAVYEEELGGMELETVRGGLGWADVGYYGMYAYLTSGATNATLTKNFEDRLKEKITALDTTMKKEGYGSTITSAYPWGSNLTIANNGMLLLMGLNLPGFDGTDLKSSCENAAALQLAYLLGRNANAYCFVTGYGDLSPQHPHHRPSQVVGKAMTGMLIGGPDSNLEDPYAKATLSGVPKAKCYADNEQSYSCNEITIYWNSAFVYLLAGVMNN